MNTHKTKYAGDRWTIVYGSYSGVEQFAVSELNAVAQGCFPYVIECVPAAGFNPETRQHLILVEDGLFEAKIQPSVAVFAETVWNPEREAKVIRESATQYEAAGNNRIPA